MTDDKIQPSASQLIRAEVAKIRQILTVIEEQARALSEDTDD